MSISATVIAYSKAPNGQTIVTWELMYPRFCHSELMTHRLFSRNAASSRAIPISKMINLVATEMALPQSWGTNQPGMQAGEQLEPMARLRALQEWQKGAGYAISVAQALDKIGLHKQIANRVLEPYQMMKSVVTTTEKDNFFWLRKDKMAQPEIQILANEMFNSLVDINPVELQPGDWHTPYFGAGYWLQGCGVPLEDALAISASCCAQVSYRVLNDSLEKAEDIYTKLIGDGTTPVHASPFEHQATPIMVPDLYCHDCQCPPTWEDGVTHVDKNSKFWSGNLKGFVQHRQLIPNNACWDYKE